MHLQAGNNMNLSVIISSFLSGLLGAMGFGGGSVLIIYLTFFAGVEQKEAQGINLIFFIAVNVFAIILNIKNKMINKKDCLKFLPLSIAGLITGYIILPIIPTFVLKKMFGGALIILGVKELFSKDPPKIRHR